MYSSFLTLNTNLRVKVMTQMKNRNKHLQTALDAITPRESFVEIQEIPQEDTTNRQGFAAYSLPDELRLVTMLNTLKLEPQFYRTEDETVKELQELIDRVGTKDPYFLAQAIVYSRCMGEGMRLINQVAAALAAPYISGREFGKRFYSLFDKKDQKGGCIFRPDDMANIKDLYKIFTKTVLSNAMKKGFAQAIESMDTYQLAKYSKAVIDIANLVHPKSALSEAVVTVNGVKMKTLDALMQGMPISADTWEVAQSEAGQVVAKAVREGKLSQEEAKVVLTEAKNDNWESLLRDGKLGILAALRNIRNMMKEPREEVIKMLVALIKDQKKIKEGLILPCYFDLAYEIVNSEFRSNEYAPRVLDALQLAYKLSIPNLAQVLTGKTLVIVDCSGSMGTPCIYKNGRFPVRAHGMTGECRYKAGLIAATIAKATHADVIQFGSSASYFKCDYNMNVFELARLIGLDDFGGTDLAEAFDLITAEHAKYDRIVIISDNEINGSITSSAWKKYIAHVCSPYIYAIDLAAYGTAPLKSESKVSYYCGYGASMYEDIKSHEFNAETVIDKIRKIVI